MYPGYNNYGGMPMPQPQLSAQSGPPMGVNRPQYSNANVKNYGSRSQIDSVMSKLDNQLDQADQSELQELHDKEEKLHELLHENSEVYFLLISVHFFSMISQPVALCQMTFLLKPELLFFWQMSLVCYAAPSKIIVAYGPKRSRISR